MVEQKQRSLQNGSDANDKRENLKMIDTPCLSCFNLSGFQNNYFCGAIRERLDNDLVNGVGVERLPNCPEYKYADIKPVEFDRISLLEEDVETKINVIKRPYQKPDQIISTVEARAEIITVVKSFEYRRGKWPTHQQIWLGCRYKSLGDVYNILNAMVEDKELKKVRSKSGRAKYVYCLP
jgi:hypothetical protein